jgi:type IV secretory pathway VirB10-like protein
MDSNNVSGAARVGLKVTRTALRLSVKLAATAVGAAIKVAQKRAASQPSTPSPAPSGPPRPAGGAPSSNGTQPPSAAAPTVPAPAPAPAPPAPPVAPELPTDLVSPEEQPDTPLTPAEAHAKTDDDVDEVVAEFAEAGAEDGAGPELHLEAPWEGYDTQNVETVNARIVGAGAAELALLELYEQSHKHRKTVLEAAQRRLKHLSPPSEG